MSSRPAVKPVPSPLTHHEILGLVEPFTRRGRSVDLAASDRLARRLAFRPRHHAGDDPSSPPCREDLMLEDLGDGAWRLTRRLTLDGGLQASLQAEGAQPALLLAGVEAVPPQRQVSLTRGVVVALSHRIVPASEAAEPRLTLVSAAARVGELTLTMKVPRTSGMPADLELTAAAGDPMDLPEDLLAVLGLDWARLCRYSQGWTGSLQLRRHEPERSRDAEAKLERTAWHLADVLAQAPGHFHERFGAARWGVALRRSIPLLVSVGLIAAAAAVPILDLPEGSVFRMLIFNAPPLLMVAFFCMREMPRIEIPPWPRRSRAPAWRMPAVTRQDAPAAAR